MGVAVTEPSHCDAAGKVEEFAAVGSVEPAALAMIDGNVPPAIGRHNGCNHGISPARAGWGKRVGDKSYRRRPNPAGPVLRTVPQSRRELPGLRIIGTLLVTAAPARRPAIEQESGGVWGW